MIWATLSRTRDRRRGGGHTALTSLEGAFLAGEVLEATNVVDVISALIDELAGAVLDEVLDKGEGLEGWRGGWGEYLEDLSPLLVLGVEGLPDGGANHFEVLPRRKGISTESIDGKWKKDQGRESSERGAYSYKEASAILPLMVPEEAQFSLERAVSKFFSVSVFLLGMIARRYLWDVLEHYSESRI